MEKDWRDEIVKGDIAEASKRTGVSVHSYHRSKNSSPKNWTKTQRKINLALKQIVEEREAEIALLTGKDQTKC